jgi:hypothetical protein
MPLAYEDHVFINCPFDEEYRPLFQALVFAVHACGMVARSALEVDNGAEVRINKIERIIRECRHSVHDISRVELDAASGLPRMNMPFELGLFLGAQRFGDRRQKKKTCIIFDRVRYRYQKFLSDIAGQDIRAHQGDPAELIRLVRNALATALPEDVFSAPVRPWPSSTSGSRRTCPTCAGCCAWTRRISRIAILRRSRRSGWPWTHSRS